MHNDLESQSKNPYRFKIGDKVWLQAKNVNLHQKSKKLGPKQLGPFAVTEVLSQVDYRLQLPPALKIHNIFHVDRLMPYKVNDVNGIPDIPSGPIEVDGEEEYEIDYIQDAKVFGRTLKFLVC